jgi:hypothetical protein
MKLRFHSPMLQGCGKAEGASGENGVNLQRELGMTLLPGVSRVNSGNESLT